MPAFSKCSLSFYQNFIDYDIGIILFENMHDLLDYNIQ